jgi:hypothetical protein
MHPPKDPAWFALTVRPNHERTAEQALSYRGLEAYVPLYRARKQWSDRVKNTQAPLFTFFADSLIANASRC